MYAYSQAQTTYANSGNSTSSDSEVEYKIFAKVTSALIAARDLPKSEFPKLAKALHDNEKLWILLATDVASPENSLPKELRAQLVYLFEFTLMHSARVREGVATVDTLVDINRSIMRGLSKRGENAA